MTPSPSAVSDFIRTNGIDALSDLGIAVKDYDDRIHLNYRQIAENRFNPIVERCRGLILSKPRYEPMCVPLMRFYNAGEDPHTDSFDWANAEIEEKLDGTLVNLYHACDDWFPATRGTSFAEGNVGSNSETFFDLFWKAMPYIVPFDDALSGWETHTFVFELTGPTNRIVRRYDRHRLSLLAVVQNWSGRELKSDEVDDLAIALGVHRPNTYRSASDLEAAKQIAADMPDDLDEGVIAKVWTGESYWRLKIKNAAYLEWARVRGNGQINPLTAIRMVLDASAIEYLLEFPEDEGQFLLPKNFIATLKEQIAKFSQHVEWDTPDQKAFALRVKDHPCAAYFFSRRNGRVDSVEQWLSESTDNALKRLKDIYMRETANQSWVNANQEAPQ